MKQEPLWGIMPIPNRDDFLREYYPDRGKMWCANALGVPESVVRSRASILGLKQNRDSAFAKDWQARAARSKVGKKRPEQALVMKALYAAGKLKRTPESIAAQGRETAKRWATRGHPRGALGMVHSAATKATISAKGAERWAAMTEDERSAAILKQRQGAVANGTSIRNDPRGTWKAAWHEIGGVRKFYRSRWEANYAHYLEWLMVRGDITKWEHEPHTFWFDGIKRGCLTYLPDFRVTYPDGRIEYHEVKGWMDARSKTKIARMAKYHPDVTLVVIAAKQYKALLRAVSALVPGWF